MPKAGVPARFDKEITTKKVIATATLQAQALRLRREGHNFDEIGEMLGTGEQNAYVLVTKALRNMGKEDTKELRTRMLDQLERLFNRANRIAMEAKTDRVAAIQAAVNVANRIAALVGADAPKVVDVHDDRQPRASDPAAVQAFLDGLAKGVERGDEGGESESD